MTENSIPIPIVAKIEKPQRAGFIVSAAIFALACMWAYWPTLGSMAHRWSTDDQYSHGFLVPLFALVLLWLRREVLVGPTKPPAESVPTRSEARDREPLTFRQWSWVGLPLVLLGGGLRLAGTYYFYEWFDFMSLLPTLAGGALLIGGWRALHWSWLPIGFLFFMMPMPYRVETAMAFELRLIATKCSTYLLQTLGFPAIAEGNVIVIDDVRIGIVGACSGLRMLVVFIALSAAVAILVQRPMWERFVILCSSVPIAMISNIVRIVLTGALHGLGYSELADRFFHDAAGYVMPIFALGLLWIVLWFLSHLLVEQEREKPVPIFSGVGPSPRVRSKLEDSSLSAATPDGKHPAAS